MESEKVKEIKEKLQEEIFIANSFRDKLRKVPTKELEKILAIINELESENERLNKSDTSKEESSIEYYNLYRDFKRENQTLKDRIAELELQEK